MKGISRIDSRNTHCWFVRIYRDAKVHSKTFSDGVYGSKAKALKAAQEYHKEYVRQHPPLPEYKFLRTKLPKNNKTGVVGVSETYSKTQGKRGEKVPCFSVTWVPTPRKPRCKKFIFYHYGGRDEAFKAAVEFRKEREREMIEALNAEDKPEKKNSNVRKPEKKELDPLEEMLANMKTRPFK